MEGFPKQIRVRNGVRVTVRPLKPHDFEALLAFFRSLPEGERFYLREDVTRADIVRGFVRDLDYSHVLPLVALESDRIVGEASLHRSPLAWMRHVGEVRVVVAPDRQRLGIATALVRELVGQAGEMGLDKIVASVVQGQTGALQCFERLGFVREAVLRQHVLDARNVPRDLVILANPTTDLWARMDDLIASYERPIDD